jgi:hypothetical protein
MAKVNLTLSHLDNYTLRLLAQKDKINAPEALKKSLGQKLGNHTLNYGAGKILINIETSYNSITIK